MPTNLSPRRGAALLVLFALLAVTLGACGSDKKDSSSTTGTTATTANNVAKIASFKTVPRTGAKPNVVGSTAPIEQFIPTLSGDAAQYFSQLFQNSNIPFTPPTTTVIGDQPVTSPCAQQPVQSNEPAYYCPADKTILFPKAWSEQVLQNAGDGGIVFLVSYLNGFHAMDELGAIQAVQDGKLSHASMELRALCLGGSWLNTIGQKKLLETGDIDEILKTVAAGGDQQGAASQFGTADERQQAVATGYNSGPAKCITINAT